MSALLQFEIKRDGWNNTKPQLSFDGTVADTPWMRLIGIGKTAVVDTLRNGGTFVLVVTPDKVTMVQRADAEEFAAEKEGDQP